MKSNKYCFKWTTKTLWAKEKFYLVNWKGGWTIPSCVLWWEVGKSENKIFSAVPIPCVCNFPHKRHLSQPTQSIIREMLKKCWRNSSRSSRAVASIPYKQERRNFYTQWRITSSKLQKARLLFWKSWIRSKYKDVLKTLRIEKLKSYSEHFCLIKRITEFFQSIQQFFHCFPCFCILLEQMIVISTIYEPSWNQ